MSSSPLRVVTIATDVDNPFLRDLLARSCCNNELELVVLRPRAWQSFSTKRHVLQAYLSSLDEGQLDELVLFTDAYDAVFVRGAAHIREQHARLGHPILVSAERNCWPLGPLGFALYGDAAPEPTRYLNSGGFIGTGRDILALQRKYPEPPEARFEPLQRLQAHGYDLGEFAFSDQYWWTLVHLCERELVGLDRQSCVFDCCGPIFPNLLRREIMAELAEAERCGTSSPLHVRERSRLQTYFQSPSRAAHVHFAGSVTKSIVKEMHDRGELPPWLRDALRADPLRLASAMTVIDAGPDPES